MKTNLNKSLQESLTRMEMPDLTGLSLTEKLEVVLQFARQLNAEADNMLLNAEKALYESQPRSQAAYGDLIARLQASTKP